MRRMPLIMLFAAGAVVAGPRLAVAATASQFGFSRSGSVARRAPLPRRVRTPALTMTGIGDEPLSLPRRSGMQAGVIVLPRTLRTARLTMTGIGGEPLTPSSKSGLTAGVIVLPARVRTEGLTMTGVGP
ncbi:MAG TPA: hypothetical protein VKA50_04700 [Gammaproteobacteria bacterium]|nr:hypothetical protein [Gammaproteobacteria bacterium]